MWIFTADGHFSIAKDSYCEDGELMVRSRVKADLQRFLKSAYCSPRCNEDLELKKPKILTIEHADYRYRAKCDVTVVAAYMFFATMEINYSTVKDNILPKEPANAAFLRKAAYYGVWGSMARFQERVHGK